MKNFIPSCNRQFHWMSSVTGDAEILSALNQQMACFYGQMESLKLYQAVLNTQDEDSPSQESVRHLMPKYVCELRPENILEVGCGNGRLYRQLRNYGYTGSYTGIEVANYIIQQNIQRHSEATWKCATAYEIPFSNNYFDVCFSLYVLEHLVYPERALVEMLRVVKPSGCLVLVFPDFVQAGRLASQKLGFSPTGTASKKILRAKVIDAFVTLYDSRFRLPKALKNAVKKFGSFPVNTRPICLSYSSLVETDIDAIYIASKEEVHNWAVAKGYQIEYPCGIEAEFAEQAFIVVRKS